MPNKFPDVGYFPEPPRGDRPLTVRNLLKLDKLFSDAEGKVGACSPRGTLGAFNTSEALF
jgi:hypothetical protein